MSADSYDSIIADLMAKRDQIDAAIEGIKLLRGAGSEVSSASAAGGGRAIPPESVPPGTFHRMSIGDAAKKYLDMVKTKQSTVQIMKGLEQGGLPPSKYNTIYAVLRRRQSQTRDIVRMGDDWVLSEWYPNSPALKKKAETSKKQRRKKGKGHKKARATTANVSANPTQLPMAEPDSELTLTDVVERLLISSGKSMTLAEMLPKLSALGRQPMKHNLARTLRVDPKKRFKDLGQGTFDLSHR